jgi:hypothetical protein
MKPAILAAAAALAVLATSAAQAGEASSGPAIEPQLNLEQKALLRCSAAFGIIAGEQQRGIESAQAYPSLGERGREYFVRAGAQLMDDLGLTRDQIDAMMRAEVAALQEQSVAADNPRAIVDAVMQPCLIALDASGL